MQEDISIKLCKDCKWRNEKGYCQNDAKIHEDEWEYRGDLSDHLVYSYDYNYEEMGTFWVGPNFGCIHWRSKSKYS